MLTIPATPAQVSYLAARATRPGFIMDMLVCARGRGFTPRQADAVNRSMQRDAAPAPAPIALGADLSGILAMFAKAGATLKRPAITLHAEGVGKVVLNVAGPTAKVPGSLNVTDGGPFGANRWYGRVTTSGEFEPGRKEPVSPALVSTLSRLAADPLTVAAESGRLSGACCFCNRRLTDAKSIANGYGPICAEKWAGA